MDSPLARKANTRRNGDAPAPAMAPDPAPDRAAAPAAAPQPALGMAEVAGLLAASRLDVAAGRALAVLDRRAASGDPEAAAIALVVRGQQAELAGLPPLREGQRRFPSPSERGAAAFAEMLSLLRMQDAQLDELHAMLAELA